MFPQRERRKIQGRGDKQAAAAGIGSMMQKASSHFTEMCDPDKADFEIVVLKGDVGAPLQEHKFLQEAGRKVYVISEKDLLQLNIVPLSESCHSGLCRIRLQRETKMKSSESCPRHGNLHYNARSRKTYIRDRLDEAGNPIGRFGQFLMYFFYSDWRDRCGCVAMLSVKRLCGHGIERENHCFVMLREE
jgi:hypothetical protein